MTAPTIERAGKGYGSGMERERPWKIERQEPVRDDAPGIFVPVADLDGADVGDEIVVDASDDGEQRTGTIAEVMTRSGKQYFRVDLRPI